MVVARSDGALTPLNFCNYSTTPSTKKFPCYFAQNHYALAAYVSIMRHNMITFSIKIA